MAKANRTGTVIWVRQPQSEEPIGWNSQLILMKEVESRGDDDGCLYDWHTDRMRGEHLLNVQIAFGTNAQLAARLLHRIADRIEKNGDKLLSPMQGDRGDFDKEGNTSFYEEELSEDEALPPVQPDDVAVAAEGED